MKKYSCFIIILFAVAVGCKKGEYLMYNNGARIQMSDTLTLTYTFVYKESGVTKDTVYLPMNTVGGITGHDRVVAVEQVPEYDIFVTRDPLTNKVIDSTAKEKPNKAVPGIHYVPFTDASLQSIMFVHADSATVKMPVVLMRDTSLKRESYRLRVRITANNEFGVGEAKMIERTIIFSDKLERFESWKTDNSASPAFINFGKYSTGKHQFMIEVLKVRIDEEWYKAIAAVRAQTNYKNLLKDALAAFNADPANISSGKAPLRETSDPTSPVVTFPQ